MNYFFNSVVGFNKFNKDFEKYDIIVQNAALSHFILIILQFSLC